jgi:hypothetical protein
MTPELLLIYGLVALLNYSRLPAAGRADVVTLLRARVSTLAEATAVVTTVTARLRS